MERETNSAGPEAETEEAEDDHIAEVEDGCGCAEIWEHLAEHRRNDST